MGKGTWIRLAETRSESLKEEAQDRVWERNWEGCGPDTLGVAGFAVGAEIRDARSLL
jgi:hypothetical protein